MTFTSTALPRHRLAIFQRSCQISQSVLPPYYPPYLLPLPFSGSTKVRNFSLCQVPSIFHPASRQGAQRYEVFRFVKPFALAPPLSSPLSEGRQSYELFGMCKPPYSQRPIPRSGGSAKVRSFSLCQAPLYSAPLFLRERKGTEILILSRLFPFCCPARRLVKTLPG